MLYTLILKHYYYILTFIIIEENTSNIIHKISLLKVMYLFVTTLPRS